MSDSGSSYPEFSCTICGDRALPASKESDSLCVRCHETSDVLFHEEMRRVELLRTVRGRDVELYDVKHPLAVTEKNHCGQLIIVRAGQGFEVKIWLRSEALDWMTKLHDPSTGFTSRDNRLDALIGNVSLLIESWGGGPYYMDIFHVSHSVTTEGEI
ncbi:MAG: hypothetical protein V2B18_07890 [Pseudomonadota bacterium]